VVVSKPEDGTATVRVAAEIHNGEPIGIYAEHVGPRSVVIDPGIPFDSAGTTRISREVVEVFGDDTATVYISHVQSAE
jgi:hypothetical protein